MRPVTRDYPVTADYGIPGTWQAGYHTGRDYGCPIGTAVRATRAGHVVSVGEAAWGAGYGTAVVVQSKGPSGQLVEAGYCHLSHAGVAQGEGVTEGQLIGRSGDTGRTFGAHLHYEERTTPYRYNDVDRSPRFDLLEATLATARRLTRRRRNQHPRANH